MEQPVKQGETKYFTVQTYAVFNRVDKSILMLNDVIEKFGYKFICVDVEELEKDFSSLLHFKNKSENDVKISLGEITISFEFYNILGNNHIFDFPNPIDTDFILLKAIGDYPLEVIDGKVIGRTTKAPQLNEFVNNFIQQLRLFKNGDVMSNYQFEIVKEDRSVIFRSGKRPSSISVRDYNLSLEETISFGKVLKEYFEKNPLTDLAISNFNLSYDINDIKTKYLTLMICLESLFNQGGEQITHTVSRHLSIIISKNTSEFEVNYYRIKELYNLRSQIVHGSLYEKDLHHVTEELQSLVRVAINYCHPLRVNKKQLFNKLNVMGFSS